MEPNFIAARTLRLPKVSDNSAEGTSSAQKGSFTLGNILTLADQIQALGYARKTGEIFVTNVPPPARINLVNGQIVDAQFGLKSGLEAAIALINLSDPHTEFLVGGDREHGYTIDLPFTHVLCEAAHRLDERHSRPTTSEVIIEKTTTLHVAFGSQKKKLILRRGPIFIGRSPKNEITIADSTVSQRHASVDYGDHGLFLKDLGSTNGTFCAGELITECWLNAQHTIQFGGVMCVFRWGP